MPWLRAVARSRSISSRHGRLRLLAHRQDARLERLGREGRGQGLAQMRHELRHAVAQAPPHARRQRDAASGSRGAGNY